MFLRHRSSTATPLDPLTTDSELMGTVHDARPTRQNTKAKLGLSRVELRYYKEKKQELQTAARKATRFTLRESVQALIERRERLKKLQLSGQGGLSTYEIEMNTRLPKTAKHFLDKNEEFMKYGESLLKVFQNRDTQRNIAVL